MNKNDVKSKLLTKILEEKSVMQILEGHEVKGFWSNDPIRINIEDFNIEFTEEEMLDFIDDWMKVKEEYGAPDGFASGFDYSGTYYCNIFLENFPEDLKETFFRYTNAYIIDFENKEKYEEKLKNEFPQISQELKEDLSDDWNKGNISMYNIYQQKGKRFKNIETYLEFQNFFKNSRYAQGKGTIYIESKEDLQRLLDYEVKGEIPDVYIEIKDMSLLPLEQLNELSKKMNIAGIEVPGEHSEKKDIYSTNQFKEIRNRIDQVLSKVDENASDLEKFLTIYMVLGQNIDYDFDEEGEVNTRDEAHNLIGGLLYGKGVCECFAKTLKQVLEIAGIECRYLVGASEEHELPNHAWNQVKIGDKWYNCDVTWDSRHIKDGDETQYCLQSDEEFIDHVTRSKTMVCEESYNRDEMNGIIKKIKERGVDLPTKDCTVHPKDICDASNELGISTGEIGNVSTIIEKEDNTKKK